jgi:hypothetical protein
MSNKELELINLKESTMKKDFDEIKDRASHAIVLGSDDITHSVEDFHSKKHIFIYNKDLSKGYFLKIDPTRVSEIARRLHTFKFKEPRIVSEEESSKAGEKLKELKDKKYYLKRDEGKRKECEATAAELRPRYTERFI